MEQILERLLTGQFGGLVVMAGVAAAIVFFLRFLYGPRGMFRDPRWDESNRRIRMRESEERERRLREAAAKAKTCEASDEQ